MVSLKNSRGQPIKKAWYTDIYKACGCVRFICDDVFGWFHNKKSAWGREQLPITRACSMLQHVDGKIILVDPIGEVSLLRLQQQ